MHFQIKFVFLKLFYPVNHTIECDIKTSFGHFLQCHIGSNMHLISQNFEILYM